MLRKGARWRGVVLVTASSVIAPSASAGAWTLAEGAQKWFATVSREDGDFGQAWRTDDFSELGLGVGWGLTAKFESRSASAIHDDRSGFRLGLQKALPLGERGSVAISGSVLAGESLDGPECIGEGLEARAAVGTSFNWWGREGFVNLEAGHRSRGGCERSVVEFASGCEFAPSWMLGLKSWREGGAETGSAKAEISLACNFDVVAVGVGWREEISGNFNERGWVLTASGTF